MRPALIGVWIMILAIVSLFVTVPLGFSTASGVLFVIGMLLSWLFSAGTVAAKIGHWAVSKLKLFRLS